MEEVGFDVPVEAGRAVFDDDLMLDAGMQADELVLELDDLHDKDDEYQTVDLDAHPVTADLEVAVDGLEAQPNTNDEYAEATGNAEEDAQDVSMTYNDEIGYEEEEGVAEEAATEYEPKGTTTSKAPPANDGTLEQRESEQEAHDVQIDLAEPKMGDDAEEQPTGLEARTENPVDQEATQQAAETKVGLNVDGLAPANPLDTAVSGAEQAGVAVSEDHPLEESQSDHDEAIGDDSAFSITDITVQYQGSSYALFGNSDMDPETYFLSDTEIATAPLSELLASIRSVIASELTPGEELVIVIDSLDLNFGERSSRDFLQRSFHQIIYCYNVLLAKGIVTETSLMLNLVVRPDPEGRFLELLEEAGIWSGADYSPDYSDASGEDEYLDDDQDVEDYDDIDNEGLDDDDDHEDVQDFEFDEQEHQDEEGQQDQEQEKEDNKEPEGLEITKNVEVAEDVEVTEDIEVSGNVAETEDVTVSADQDEASEEHTEPQLTEDVPENERETEQFSLEDNIDQAAQAGPSADINGESHIGAGEPPHDPSGIVDIEHEMGGDLGELQPNLEGTGSELEHAPEMKSATDEPQPENGDHTEAINEEGEEEVYDEDEYLEHHEEAGAEEQEDDEANHAAGAEEFGDDLTLRQTFDNCNFSLDIMDESTEGNAVLGLDDNETGKFPSFVLSTKHNPGTHSHIHASRTSEAKDDDLIDYTDDEGPTHIIPSLKRKPRFPDLSLRAKKMRCEQTDETLPPLHSRPVDNVSGGSQVAVHLRPTQHRGLAELSPFRSDSPCTEKSNSPVNFSAPQRGRGGRCHSHKDSDLSVTFSVYDDADKTYQGNNDISTRNPDSAAIQAQYTDDGPKMDDYTEVENALEAEYTHERSHLTINTADSRDQTDEGAHDFTVEEPANHTSTTNTMSGDEIDYDEHEDQDGSFETGGQVQEFSNAQDDDDEIGWGDDGEEDNDESTQQTTTSQDQLPFTAKRGRTDDLDEEAEEADVKRRRT
ncbi:hypothetical protein QBC32DRAFT_317206 [Pseudoneurospora amorphoporcata]|uniref:Uncharacterized protein n=1 Tax=Pseudoneurospora amorphoporcata TaxID=241081 RepID=A0AAN6NNF0_9PEZI|nr:hypothetical protein QBC32DRAFT_317206 [Pseudoneurospora amorphoporcata]